MNIFLPQRQNTLSDEIFKINFVNLKHIYTVITICFKCCTIALSFMYYCLIINTKIITSKKKTKFSFVKLNVYKKLEVPLRVLVTYKYGEDKILKIYHTTS